MKFELADMLRSGCELAKDGMLIGIYDLTGGTPCNECGFRRECKPRHDMELSQQHRRRFNPSVKTETNAEIAARLHTTPRQVSKMRKRGEI